MPQLGLGLGFARGSSFNPSNLFISGSRGFFYDFSDYTTQFTDTAGTTAITGVGQSLGLVLDKSAGLALGPELVANGDFSSGLTGWTLIGVGNTSAVSGGVAQITGTTSPGLRRSGILTVGRTYRVSLRIRRTAGSAAAFYTPPLLSAPTLTGDWQTVNYYGVATAVDFEVGLSGTATGTTLEVDDISIRELPGNHATQATAGSRALTQVRPMFTQRNRAVGSELPENVTYWPASISSNGITATKVASGVDTDGLPYVDYSVVGTASATSLPLVYGTASRTPATLGQQYFASFRAQIISGTVPPANCGIRAEVAEETAPSTFLTASVGAVFASTTEGTVFATATLASAGVNQASGRVVIRTESGSTVNYTIRIKGLQLELGSTRTTYQPAVSGELRNRAIGSGDVGNATYWPASIVQSGITVTKTAFGVDADGLSFVDLSVSGTATISDIIDVYATANSRTAAASGQTFTGSARVQVISGAAPPANCGFRLDIRGETAPSTNVETGFSSVFWSTTESIFPLTYTLANAATNQVRLGVIIRTEGGATVNYTIRIKGLQFEQNATYSRYQRTITANEWYEPGFTSYRGLRFDGTDDFLQTAAIDFAGAEVLGSELVSNGTFGTGDLTGWTTAHTAPSTVSVVAGVATWSTDGVNAARIRQSFTTVVGRTYTVSCAGAGVSVSIGTTAGGAEIVALATNNSRPAFTFVATSTTTWLNTTTATNGATLDNVSVKEVLIPADKMTVVAGVRKLSDAARGVLVELGNTAGINAFVLDAPGTIPASELYRFVSGGSTIAIAAAASASFAAPNTVVQTGIGNISGDSSTLRLNGTQVAQITTDQGTGNFANDIVYIGRRGGTTLPFNGIITVLCVINRTLTAGELAALEAYANSRTGAY